MVSARSQEGLRGCLMITCQNRQRLSAPSAAPQSCRRRCWVDLNARWGDSALVGRAFPAALHGAGQRSSQAPRGYSVIALLLSSRSRGPWSLLQAVSCLPLPAHLGALVQGRCSRLPPRDAPPRHPGLSQLPKGGTFTTASAHGHALLPPLWRAWLGRRRPGPPHAAPDRRRCCCLPAPPPALQDGYWRHRLCLWRLAVPAGQRGSGAQAAATGGRRPAPPAARGAAHRTRLAPGSGYGRCRAGSGGTPWLCFHRLDGRQHHDGGAAQVGTWVVVVKAGGCVPQQRGWRAVAQQRGRLCLLSPPAIA